MKKIILLIVGIIASLTFAYSQTVTLESPVGLPLPYEVASGTQVTFKWDYFGSVPTAFFSYNANPGSLSPYQYSPNPVWTNHSGGWVDNLDGTYSLTITINNPTWVFAGLTGFSGYAYSNVIEVGIASSVVASSVNDWICPGGLETISVVGTYDSYQWYMDGSLIPGATNSTYDATLAGGYYVETVLAGIVENSNTLNLNILSIDMNGVLAGSNIILSGDAGMGSYQWLSGATSGSLTAIAGATSVDYTAPITSSLVYYAIEGTLNGCTVTSTENIVVDTIFEKPILTLNADTNSFGKVCEGTTITITGPVGLSNYDWYKNGNSAWGSTNVMSVSQPYQAGFYQLGVANSYWPSITVISDSIEADYFSLIEPVLTNVINNSYHCDGENLAVLLSDEGYTYSWFVHSSYNQYNSSNEVIVPGSVYNFVFDSTIYITVEGEYLGCVTTNSLLINDMADKYLSINVQNYDQAYLCTDSTAILTVPNYQLADFENFQWYELIGSTWTAITGADSSVYMAATVGEYMVEANVVGCLTAIVQSNVKEIKDYTERILSIWTADDNICTGDTATLNISGAGWNAIQWHEQIYTIGSSGYEPSYVPMLTGGNTSSQGVTEYNRYEVKAKHNSCPNGLKLTSNIVEIKPTVNPNITLITTPSSNSTWQGNYFDSTYFALYCSGQDVSMTVPDHYDSYSWHYQPYAGIDDYQVGTMIPGAIGDSISRVANVEYITVIIDSAGCIGQSDPIVLDMWAFNSPAIASYGNAEFCISGDSALIHLGFPGDWGLFEWYLDGVLIPNSDNDSLWVDQVGMYTITAYPTACPTFGYSSGVGPIFTILEASILENDTLIYAMPELGNYTYQWYLNGLPIPPSDPNVPWILLKEDMVDGGVYTVEVTNPEPCTSLSDPYIYDAATGIEEESAKVIRAYPNPTNGVVNIEGVNFEAVSAIEVYSIIGKKVNHYGDELNDVIKVDLSNLNNGIYFIQLKMYDGSIKNIKVNKF